MATDWKSLVASLKMKCAFCVTVGTTAIEVLNGKYQKASPGPCCATRPP
jgi:hypothetical protein